MPREHACGVHVTRETSGLHFCQADPHQLTTSSLSASSVPTNSRKRKAGRSDSIRSMGVGRPYAPQRIFMRPHDMSWAKHSHSPVRERSPNISLDGVMQDAAYLLRRIPLPRTRVNKAFYSTLQLRFCLNEFLDVSKAPLHQAGHAILHRFIYRHVGTNR